MDEIGMVVTQCHSDGSLSVAPSGGLWPWKIGERPVTILGHGDPVPGITSLGSTHTRGAGERKVTWREVRILTGLGRAELEDRGIRPGAVAVPSPETRGPVFLGSREDPFVAAWTFDDRMGLVALLRLLETLGKEKRVPLRPLLVCFTVQEEAGCLGARILARRERPEIFVAVDGCPCTPDSGAVLDDRPGIWSRDARGPFDNGLIEAFHTAAQDAGCAFQTLVYDAASSDASAARDTGASPRCTTIGHVRENSHGFEMAKLAAFDNVWKTLVRLVTSFA
jgi:putative aminopeptidase FrvX